jgi:Flp pilus assembly protein TadG
MKAPAIPKLRNALHARRERGVTMVLVAVAMVAIIAMAALSIDVISLYLIKEEAQRSADAAALAAARVISISGLTGDPGNTTPSWPSICGGLISAATQAATAVANQNAVGGTAATSVHVTYSAGGVSVLNDCTPLVGGPFGVNPMITVQVVRAGLPTFFSRIWGNAGNTVSATATAEAFNPSASDFGTGVTPVQPTCVKPLMVPNQDPYNPVACNTGTNPLCLPFVSPANGAIQHPGMSPVNPTGVIGETFTLFADCSSGVPCTLATPQPQANVIGGTFNGFGPPATPNLQYLPGQAPATAVAVPTCAVSGGGGNPLYAPAVAGCDQTTAYQCGVNSAISATPNLIDLAENPGGPPPTGDTASAIACLLTNDPTTAPLIGQDSLVTGPPPFKITAGASNPNVSLRGDFVSSSNSIVSLPIYDNGVTITANTTPVTIVGFLQVFINDVNTDGSLNVTVLNVAGCGNNATNVPIPGTSPVPVRLVTPP